MSVLYKEVTEAVALRLASSLEDFKAHPVELPTLLSVCCWHFGVAGGSPIIILN